MTLPAALRDKVFLSACAYVGGLFVSIIALWWMILIGGNPIEVKNIGAVSSTGLPLEKFRAGEVAGIRRQVCTSQSVAIHFYPALKDSRGFVFPLPIGMAEMSRGCHETTYGFVVPDLPAGEYSYINAVSFQNNLVGRDETTTYPPIRIRIMR